MGRERERNTVRQEERKTERLGEEIGRKKESK